MRPFAVAAAGRTDPGLRRANNEDSFHIGEQLLVVADGVGGAAAGEVASQTVVQIFAGVRHADTGDDLYRVLAESVERSTDRINQLVRGDPDLEGMGTTATVMMWAPDRIVFAHIGDSRAYLMRQAEPRQLRQITRDDSFVQYLLDSGMITAEQAGTHPKRNVILKAVNGMSVTPQFSTLAPVIGDRYLLCSDGLSDCVDASAIAGVLREEQDREAAADALIRLTLDAGGPDNVTAIVADVVERPGS